MRVWRWVQDAGAVCEGRHSSRFLKAADPREWLLGPFSKGIILFDALHPIDMYRVFHVFDLMAPNKFALAVVPYALICLGAHIDAILA